MSTKDRIVISIIQCLKELLSTEDSYVISMTITTFKVTATSCSSSVSSVM